MRCQGSKISALVKMLGLVSMMVLAINNEASAAPKSTSYIAVDVNTGRVLASKQADSLRHPASLTKMMTLYVLFDAIESGQVSMNTRFEVSKNAESKPASKLYLKAGSTITVREAIDALIVKSANDVATVVAENLSGSEPKFARLMTRSAKDLGMSKTRFVNASGLHDERQVTTARDMYKLGLALQDRFPTLYTRFRQSSFVFRGKRIGGHNPFLGNWRGVDGIKTGYTRASGFNLVSNYKLGRKHVVAVVVGSDTSAARNATMRSILNHSIGKSSNTWRRTAKLDQDLYIATNFSDKLPQGTVLALNKSLTPRLRPASLTSAEPETDIQQQTAQAINVAIASAQEMAAVESVNAARYVPLPPKKPQLFIDYPEFFARDFEAMVIMVESYQEAYDELYGDKKNTQSIASSDDAYSETKRPRKRTWTGNVDDYQESTSNVSYTEDSFDTVSCMETNTCYVAGVVKTKGGHYRVEDSEIFALVTSSGEE